MRNFLLICALATGLAPQGDNRAPKQIFLAPYEESGGKTTRVAFLVFDTTGFRIGKPVVNITTHRWDDDEPSFLPDATGFLFASNRDGKQYDVFRYDIKTKAATQVTRTPEDEREPRASRDGRTFTVIRGTERRLWRFAMDGSDAGAVSPHQGPIVSHAWLTETRVAAIADSADQPALQIIDSATHAAETIESGVGRSLFVRPDGSSIGFLKAVARGDVVMREWAVAARKARETGFALEDAAHMAVTPKGAVLMARQSKVIFFEPQTDRWVEFADLDKSRVTGIARLAVSPDSKWIAVVSSATVK